MIKTVTRFSIIQRLIILLNSNVFIKIIYIYILNIIFHNDIYNENIGI